MHETEIKILEIDRKEIEKKLISMGAKKVFDDEIHAIYYDFPDKSLKNANKVLRLRKEGGKSVLTCKKNLEGTEAKVMEETELEVSDFLTMKLIFELLGFTSWLEMKKHRTRYELCKVHFELDKYYGKYNYIPEFLEIEGPDVAAIYKYAELLGFTQRDCRPWDAVQIADYYSCRIS